MINLSMYKVIYKNKVYNAISGYIYLKDETENGHRDEIASIDILEVIVINEDGHMISIRDNGKEFQFLPK